MTAGAADPEPQGFLVRRGVPHDLRSLIRQAIDYGLRHDVRKHRAWPALQTADGRDGLAKRTCVSRPALSRFPEVKRYLDCDEHGHRLTLKGARLEPPLLHDIHRLLVHAPLVVQRMPDENVTDAAIG